MMRLEHIQYFVEVATVGSISRAAKNLFISQQGVSNALQQLEKEVGFPLLNRQKRGVGLTNNGAKFFHYAVNFLDEYNKMLQFSQNAAIAYANKYEDVCLMATPLVINLLAEVIFDEKAQKIPAKIRLYESDFAQIIEQIQTGQAQLGIFFLQQNFLPIFRSSVSEEIELMELFEDKACCCLSAAHPLADQETIDYDSVSGLKICPNSSYYAYFDQHMTGEPDIRSNDIALHCQLIKQKNALSLSTVKTFPYTYHDPQIIMRPLSKPARGKFYLARNTRAINKGVIAWITHINAQLAQL